MRWGLRRGLRNRPIGAELKITGGPREKITPGVWHANRLNGALEMTPEGAIQSEAALKQSLEERTPRRGFLARSQEGTEEGINLSKYFRFATSPWLFVDLQTNCEVSVKFLIVHDFYSVEVEQPRSPIEYLKG